MGPRTPQPHGPAPVHPPWTLVVGGTLASLSHHPPSLISFSKFFKNPQRQPRASSNPSLQCSQDFPGFLPRFIIERSWGDFPNQQLVFSPNAGKWVFSYCLCAFSTCSCLITAAWMKSQYQDARFFPPLFLSFNVEKIGSAKGAKQRSADSRLSRWPLQLSGKLCSNNLRVLIEGSG